METINTTYDYATKFPPIGEETVGTDTVHKYVRLHDIDKTRHENARVRFDDRDLLAMLDQMLSTAPTTVGQLWASFLIQRVELHRTRKQLTALQDGMESVNQAMNSEATEQNMCSAYEELLESLNGILRQHGYTGHFQFTGRTKTVRIEVQRERVVQETTSVELEVMHGDDPDYDMAYEMASEMDLMFWNVQDDHYNDMDYTVIHEETID